MKTKLLSMWLLVILLFSMSIIRSVSAVEENDELHLPLIQKGITVKTDVEINNLIPDLDKYKQFQEKIYSQKNSLSLNVYDKNVCKKADERLALIKQYELSTKVEIIDADIKYTVENVECENNIYTVKIYEYILFEYGYSDIDMTDISGYGIMHTMVIEKIENNFFVVSDEYVDDYMLEYSCVPSNNYLTDEDSISLASVNYNYDYSPNAAVAYADTWVPHSINGGCNPSYYNPAYTYYNGNDCANYVSQCLYAGGMPQTSTWKPGVSTWTTVAGVRDYFNNYGTNVKLTSSNIKDVVWKGCPLYIKNSSNSHVVICTGYSSDGWPYLNGHTNDRYHQRVPTGYYTNTIQLTPYKDYEPNAYHNPEGTVDVCSGGENSVYVRGWAFDRDATEVSVPVHIYIGGSAGATGAEGYPISANTYRPDVNGAYGVGDYHGFEASIPTGKTGTQEVYIYACNVAGEGGDNVCLGSYTVNITNETQPPAISDVKITDVSEQGYTVSCTVNDNSGIEKVLFPVWTNYNSQDDIIWHTGTIKGNTATCTVNISDHNNEHAHYCTHIYAYDIHGNATSTGCDWVYVPMKSDAAKELTYKNSKYILFNNENRLMWHEAKLYCEEIGGHLATITSIEEQNIISSLIAESKSTNIAYYLGGTDSETEGTWKWISDENWDFSYWNTGEPNNGGSVSEYENCLSIYGSSHKYTWVDTTNNPQDQLGFICEIELPYTETKVDDYGTYKLCNTKIFNVDVPCSIIVSSYKDGQLLSCEIREVIQESYTFAITEQADDIKVMLWDKMTTLNPVCDSEIVPKSKWGEVSFAARG